MKHMRISQLSDITDGQVFQEIMPGKYIKNGALSYAKPGARSHSHPGEPKDHHTHDDIETFIVIQGKGKLELDGKFYDMIPGDIYAVEPGEDHHIISSEDDPTVVMWIHAGDVRSKKHFE